MRNQQTLRQSISCVGVGLHSGQPVTMTLQPAPPNTGVVFLRQEGDREISIRAAVKNLIPTELCTALQVNGTQIQTVEHLLSALAGTEIDNLFIQLNGGEVPAMDGSAGAFVRLIQSAGVVAQGCPQPFLKITDTIEVEDGNRLVRIEPSLTPKITYMIEYNHPLIETQRYEYDLSVSTFEREIAGARTFAFLKEVEALWARGLGKGGSLENTVVLSDDGIMNNSGLRYKDEFVRHKVLDLIGDLSLLGIPFIGHLTAQRSGHALHTKLVEQILAHPEKWMLLNAPEEAERMASRFTLKSRKQPAPTASVQPSPAF